MQCINTATGKLFSEAHDSKQLLAVLNHAFSRVPCDRNFLKELLLVVVYLPALFKTFFFVFQMCTILCVYEASRAWAPVLSTVRRLSGVLFSCANTAGWEMAVKHFLSVIWVPREVKDNDRGMLS